MFDNSFPACAFVFLVEISSCTLIPHFRPGSVHSGSASWDDCDRVFPDELCLSLFPDRVPTLCMHSIVRPLLLRWVKGVCVFRCNLPPAFLAEWLESFTCHCDNTGWNGHQIRVSTQSWLWRRNFSHCSCRDLNSVLLPTSYPSSHACSNVVLKSFYIAEIISSKLRT